MQPKPLLLLTSISDKSVAKMIKYKLDFKVYATIAENFSCNFRSCRILDKGGHLFASVNSEQLCILINKLTQPILLPRSLCASQKLNALLQKKKKEKENENNNDKLCCSLVR